MALISLNHRFNHYQLFVYYLTLIDICLLIGIDSTDQIKIIESNVTIYSDNETNYFNLSAVSLSNQFKSAKIDDNLTTTTESTTINKINVINFDEGEQLRNESTISVPKELPIKLSTDNPIDCVNTTVNLTVINDIINLTTTKLTNNKLVDLSIVTKLSSNMIMIKPVNDTNNITINKVDYNQHHHDNDSVNDDNNNLVKMKLNITSKSVESLPEKNSSVNDVDNQQTINTSVNGFKVNHDHGVNLNHDDDEIISTPFSINITTSITTGTIDNDVNNGPSKWSVNLTNSDHNNNGNNNNDHHHLPDDDNEYPHGKFQQHHQTKLDQHEITSQLQVSSTDEDEDSDSDSGGQIVVIGGVNNPGVGTGTTGGSGGINDGESDLYLVSSRRKCQPSHSHGIYWDSIDASLMASKLCPSPYMGTAYRACYSMGHWDTPDLTECRLPHLREIQNLIFYHVHKHLVDGLYPLAEELNRLLLSTSIPILSPMDKLDALDSLNSILKAKVRIKLDEDEDRDHLFIKSLISSSEQLLTKLPLTFTIETEKNALLTMKSAETIFGLKALSESLLRTLIVFCNDGTIRRIKSFNSITKNIAITLTHITPFGDRISLLHSELNSDSIEMESDKQNNSEHPNRPKAHIFLDDLRRYGIGISEICLHLIGNDFNTDTINLISDLIVISVVPPISIEANFERIPQVEIDFNLTPSELRLASDNLICGKIKSPRELWSQRECQIIYRNSSFIRCSCSELGVFGIIHVKSSTFQQHSYNHHHSQCHFNPLTLYFSSGLSLILILITMVGQMSTMIKCQNHWKSCYILLNLLTSLALIEIIFLFGGPIHSSSFSYQQLLPSSSSSLSSGSHISSSQFWTSCKVISMILHYLHLVAAFTMLSYSIYLFKKLWRYHEDIIMITDVNNNSESSSCYSDTIGSTILPITVTTSNNNNSNNSQQQLSESIQSTNHNQYYQTRQQQQQQTIQRSQSLSASSSYSSFPYSFSSSSSSSSTTPATTDSYENALITWNQPNLHKEPESRQIVHLLLFTWAGPLLCVVTSNIINPLGYETKRYCWMSIEGGMMFSFIVPVSILIMSNTITMLLILKRFFAYKPITHKIEIERVEPALRSGVSLLPFFAVNWFLSVLALEDTATDIFQYLFAFCNLIQHLLVFLFHCYQRPEIYQRFSMYFAYGNGSNRISKSSLKSKRNYWCSGHCATVPLLIYSDDGSARLHDNCFDDPTIEASRFKDQ